MIIPFLAPLVLVRFRASHRAYPSARRRLGCPLLVEELIYLSRRLRIDSRHLRKVGQARTLDRLQRAEMAQQSAFARGTNSRNLLQASLANVFLAPRAVRADGKAVGLVAQPLDEIQQRIARRQLERRPARHEES